MEDVFSVADYFLSLQSEDFEDYISNLKLQKLCYYAQGLSLAMTGRRLFDNDVEAWQHGPVVRCLYEKYKVFGKKMLPVSEDFTSDKISEESRELLDDVFGRYGQYSAWKLREMTHSEYPWKRAKVANNLVISDEDMMSFFKANLG